MLTPTFGGCYLCATLAKINQEMRPWKCGQTEHAATETNWTYDLYHVMCYSHGADKTYITTYLVSRRHRAAVERVPVTSRISCPVCGRLGLLCTFPWDRLLPSTGWTLPPSAVQHAYTTARSRRAEEN